MKRLVLIALGLALLPTLASAATFMVEKDGNVLVKSASDIRDNIYAAGKSVSVQQVVFGDVVAAGATVSITENVSDDVAAAGANVSLLSNVGGDARLAGSSVTVNGVVTKDLLAAGGALNVTNKTTVGGDMVLAGGQVTFDGKANKTARIYGGEVVINGTINGDTIVAADKKLSFGEGAKINGNLTYKARKEMEIPAGVVSGKVTYENAKGAAKMEGAKGIFAAIWGAFTAIAFLMMLIGALAILYFMPRLTREVTETSLLKSGQSILRGLVTLIVMPIAGIILVFTVLGWFIGWSAIVVFVLLIVLSKVLSSVVLGSWIAKLVKRDGQTHLSWKTVTLGALALTLLVLIPVVGWLIALVVWLITFGAVASYIYEKLWLSSR